MSMRALVFTAPGEVVLRDVDEPTPGPDDVVLTVHASGICGSELHGFRALGMRVPPLVMGHEVVGTTEDGRRVAVNPLLSCGACDLCNRGLPQVCRTRGLLGVHRPGGFAERVAVPIDSLHDLPPDVDWVAAAMIEPLANAVHAIGLAPEVDGGRVGIIGAGALGLLSLAVARLRGAAHVTIVDPSPTRLATAQRLGADVVAATLDAEHDVVIDAVGLSTTRAASLRWLRPAGTAVWIGLAAPEATIDGNDVVRGERKVAGSFAYTSTEFATAVHLSSQLDLGWATAVPLNDSQRVFMELAEGRSDIVRAVICP